MNKLSLAAAVLLAAATAFAAPAPRIHLVSFTGTIEVTVDGKTTTVDATHSMADIPAGAQITVVSGEATFQSGGVVVSAVTGDSFSIGSDRKGDVQISASAGSMTVTVGNTTAKLDKGDDVLIAPAHNGASSVSVLSGNVSVTTGGQTSNIGAGGTISASIPTVTQGNQGSGPANPNSAGNGNNSTGNGNGGAGLGGGIGGGAGNPNQDLNSISRHHP